jgi:TonB-linked SusC/RagA family outer membrane protein
MKQLTGCSLSLLFLFTVLNSYAQQQISGRVTSGETGSAISGASVVFEGTAIGTVSDREGRFSLSVPHLNGRLIFSSIGYDSLLVDISNRTQISISLSPVSQALADVVVVGYGTQKRRDVTGSIASVSVSEIQNQPASNIETLLQGRASGVQISQGSGAPGGGLNIRIRGGSSINAGNEPLYVIDGVPVYNNNKDPSGSSYTSYTPTNALTSIDPNDIESIQILKDASATAIYGSRGSNGVIIITTKRGRGNRTSVSYNAYYGMQKLSGKLDLMNGTEHAEFLNDWAVASGLAAPFPNPKSIGVGTDWQDEVFRSAPIQNHQLSLSSAKSNVRYFISGNYFNQQGIAINSGMQRYALRVNLDAKLHEKVNFSQSFTLNRTINNSVPTSSGGSAANNRSAGERAYVTSPTIPVVDASGRYVDTWYGAFHPENPVAALNSITSRLTGDNVLGSVSLDYEIIDGLKLRTLLGLNVLNRGLEEYYPKATTYIGGILGGVGVVSDRKQTNILNENTVTYRKTFNLVHDFEALGGFTWQTEKDFTSLIQPAGFPDDRLGTNSIGASTGVPVINSNRNEWSLASYLGRINYQFNNKYLITASLRADGSSRFGKGNKWGYFPSVALGYRLSEEPFIRNLDIFNDLKLRASYGLTGNQEIGSYQSLARLVTTVTYVFDNTLMAGARQTSLENSELRWEKSAQFNIGIDLAVFNNRLRFTGDYYKKKTNDLLFTINLPSNSGYSSALFNTGEVVNEGFELNAGGDILNKSFTWTVDGNYSRNKNKITSLGRNASTSLFIGYPPGVILGYQYDGVFHNQAEIDAQTAQRTAKPGDARYRDTNNDNVINADDRVILGQPLPVHIVGLNNSFSYKGFSLSVFLQGSYGAKGMRITSLFNPGDQNGNKARELVNRWTPANPESDIPRAGFTNLLSPSTYDLEDLSYMKIRNVQLSYTIPKGKTPIWSNLTLYLSGQNLVTFTDYSGYDPDGGNQYPTSRTVIVGANITF